MQYALLTGESHPSLLCVSCESGPTLPYSFRGLSSFRYPALLISEPHAHCLLYALTKSVRDELLTIVDCDQRTCNLIRREVLQELKQQYGSVHELTLFKITHEEDQVTVVGEFVARHGEQEKRFAMVMPRVNVPLDYFLWQRIAIVLGTAGLLRVGRRLSQPTWSISPSPSR
jgi:hypothetical protein